MSMRKSRLRVPLRLNLPRHACQTKVAPRKAKLPATVSLTVFASFSQSIPVRVGRRVKQVSEAWPKRRNVVRRRIVNGCIDCEGRGVRVATQSRSSIVGSRFGDGRHPHRSGGSRASPHPRDRGRRKISFKETCQTLPKPHPTA
jgi:hypothetical protein